MSVTYLISKSSYNTNTAHEYNRGSAEEEMGFIPGCTAGVERLARGLGGRSLENTEQAAALGPAETSREGSRGERFGLEKVGGGRKDRRKERKKEQQG